MNPERSPLALTGDASKAPRIVCLPSDFTASYKLYFMKAVFDKVNEESMFVV